MITETVPSIDTPVSETKITGKRRDKKTGAKTRI